MNRVELSLLLFLETRAVDHGGRVDLAHMNKEDMEIAKGWSESGYLKRWQRLPAGMILGRGRDKSGSTHYVELSEQAWTDAHMERRRRANRMRDELIKSVLKVDDLPRTWEWALGAVQGRTTSDEIKGGE